MNCNITDEELQWFLEQYSGVSQCSEYGACECCPYFTEEEEE